MMKEQIGSLETHYTEALEKEMGKNNPNIEKQVRSRVEDTLGRDVCKQVTDFQEKLTAHRQSSNQTVFGKAIDSAIDPQVEQYLAINEKRLRAGNFDDANDKIREIIVARNEKIDMDEKNLKTANAALNNITVKGYLGVKYDSKGQNVDSSNTQQIIHNKKTLLQGILGFNKERLRNSKPGPDTDKKSVLLSKSADTASTKKTTQRIVDTLKGLEQKSTKEYYESKPMSDLQKRTASAVTSRMGSILRKAEMGKFLDVTKKSEPKLGSVFQDAVKRVIEKTHEHKDTIEKNAPKEEGGPDIKNEKDGPEMKGGPR